MGNRLSGKTVAITGASQGIGLAIAQRFAEEGADISFCYRSNKAGADEVVANIQKTGRKVAGFQYDISSIGDGQKFIAATAAQNSRSPSAFDNCPVCGPQGSLKCYRFKTGDGPRTPSTSGSAAGRRWKVRRSPSICVT